MNVVVTAESHYLRTPYGVRVVGKLDYAHWASYRDVFDQVFVLARVRPVPTLPEGARPVEGDGVAVIAAPDFVGTEGLTRNLPALVRAAARAELAGDAFILHAPGVMATALHAMLFACGRPYGIEVVGDPAESLAGHRRVLRAFRGVGAALQRVQVARAHAAHFVTRTSLQLKYPPRAGCVAIAASDAMIPDEVFDEEPVAISEGPTLRIAFVGALAQPYKGLDVLIDAVAQCRRHHTLDVVGDGRLRADLEARATARHLRDRIRFHGALPPGEAVYGVLRSADIFVLPSRTEGLPRALVEAMAVGLPCLASRVGGVPELLDGTEMLPVGDAPSLARELDALGEDPGRRWRLGAANRARAHEFRRSRTIERVRLFHEAVRDTARR